jgi:hypothetical protein
LQQTVDGIKTENGVDVLSEEDSTVMGMGEAHVLSMFPVEGAEPQVSCFETFYIAVHVCT